MCNEYVLCAGHGLGYFTYKTLFNSHDNSGTRVLLFPFNKWGHWGSERWNECLRHNSNPCQTSSPFSPPPCPKWHHITKGRKTSRPGISRPHIYLKYLVLCSHKNAWACQICVLIWVLAVCWPLTPCFLNRPQQNLHHGPFKNADPSILPHTCKSEFPGDESENLHF